MIIRPIAICLALSLAACSSTPPAQQSLSERNPGADFSTITTYSFLREVEGDYQAAFLSGEAEPYLQIQRALESEMASRGYRKVSAQESDVTVGFLVAVQDRVSNRVVDRYFGSKRYGQAADSNRDLLPQNWKKITDVERGMLVIDLSDASSGKSLWRAAEITPITTGQTERVRDNMIRSIVSKTMRTLPPAGN